MDAEIRDRIQKLQWFHSIDLGEITTRSWVYGDHLPPNYHLFSVFSFLEQIEVCGQDCLDLGTYDGMVAFMLDKLGARRVTATCQFDLERFRLCRSILGCENIDYRPGYNVETMEEFLAGDQFDLIVVSGMLHQLFYPLQAIVTCRNLLKRNGLFILEAAFLSHSIPSLTLNTEYDDPVYGAPNIWLPSRSALLGMLKLAAFDPLATVELVGTELGREANYRRMAILARACRPSEISSRRPKLKELQDKVPEIGNMNYSRLEQDSSPPSTIVFQGDRNHRELNIWTYTTNLPLQPRWTNPPPQATASTEDLTSCRLATCADFVSLRSRYRECAWDAKDTHLLTLKYPGVVFPEGQAWGLKQMGNLFCIDRIQRSGARKILEVGAGFNLYFDRHLGAEYEYWMIDEAGFYEVEVFAAAQKRRLHTRFVNGLLGEFSKDLLDEYFDVVFSVSVLEHLPLNRIEPACQDMFRLLRHGGYVVHSIDLSPTSTKTHGVKYLQALRDTGLIFHSPQQIEWHFHTDPERQILLEPLSLVYTFYGGYQEDFSATSQNLNNFHTGSLLVCGWKP